MARNFKSRLLKIEKSIEPKKTDLILNDYISRDAQQNFTAFLMDNSKAGTIFSHLCYLEFWSQEEIEDYNKNKQHHANWYPVKSEGELWRDILEMFEAWLLENEKEPYHAHEYKAVIEKAFFSNV
ncbi:hypothetical protein P4475_17780 [Halalkalibacterium halodurans]|uniref:hypothetical protein n=1 Tax=Halalkalibacterium halodurans TaxID=86665 RepID=UPI0010678F0B|nr:hypothetical protein [Halalkalibacterium halodurans]MED3648623.1 hypothetical protein [Halalkalibacterium halodurans]TES47605.1 hypothetical protein E2L07_18690 [Halalkalibacterium halodurans]